MPQLFKTENNSANIAIRVDVFTPRDENIGQEDRDFLSRNFIQLIFNVLLFEISLYFALMTSAVLLWATVVFSIYLVYTTGRIYIEATFGRGLRSTYLFFENVFQYFSPVSNQEIVYGRVKQVIDREDGIVIELKEAGHVHFLPHEAIEESRAQPDLNRLLKRKFGSRFAKVRKTQEQIQLENAAVLATEQERINLLGNLVSKVSYTVTSQEMRAYHRMLFTVNPLLKSIRGTLIPVMAAVTTAMPILGWILAQPVFDFLFPMCLAATGVFILLPMVGLTFAARSDFLAQKDELLECYLHQNGIAAKTPQEYRIKTWTALQHAAVTEDGIIADMGPHETVFLPGEVMSAPVLGLIKAAVAEARSAKKEKDGENKGKTGKA